MLVPALAVTLLMLAGPTEESPLCEGATFVEGQPESFEDNRLSVAFDRLGADCAPLDHHHDEACRCWVGTGKSPVAVRYSSSVGGGVIEVGAASADDRACASVGGAARSFPPKVKGIGLGSRASEVRRALGNPSSEDGTTWTFECTRRGDLGPSGWDRRGTTQLVEYRTVRLRFQSDRVANAELVQEYEWQSIDDWPPGLAERVLREKLQGVAQCLLGPKGGVAILWDRTYALVGRADNTLMLADGKEWTGRRATEPELVVVYSGRVYPADALPQGLDLDRSIAVSFEPGKVRAYAFGEKGGCYYSRSLPKE